MMLVHRCAVVKGASMCAVHDGRSIASTMGFTALDGSEYDQAKKQLRHLAREGRLVRPDYRSGALFVAYCAE